MSLDSNPGERYTSPEPPCHLPAILFSAISPPVPVSAVRRASYSTCSASGRWNRRAGLVCRRWMASVSPRTVLCSRNPLNCHRPSRKRCRQSIPPAYAEPGSQSSPSSSPSRRCTVVTMPPMDVCPPRMSRRTRATP